MNRRRVLLVALLALGLVLSGCSSSGSGGASSKPSQLADADHVGPYEGFGLSPAQPRPAFTLTDTAGKSFAFGSVTSGHPTLLYFGYTHCPDACPETMADVMVALKDVPATVAAKTYVVFVTTDVKRDTAPVISKWLGNFSGSSKATFVGLRGTQAQIDAAQAAAHIALAEDDGEQHSTQLLLYGTDNYARVSYLLSNNEQKQIAHDLPLVAK